MIPDSYEVPMPEVAPNFYVNEFMVEVLRDWVEAGSGDEWGEDMSSMLDAAEAVACSYEEVSDYLWRKVLEQIPYFAWEHFPNSGDLYQFDGIERAIDRFPLHLEKAQEHGAWHDNHKLAIQQTADALPFWMKEHGHIIAPDWMKD